MRNRASSHSSSDAVRVYGVQARGRCLGRRPRLGRSQGRAIRMKSTVSAQSAANWIIGAFFLGIIIGGLTVLAGAVFGLPQ